LRYPGVEKSKDVQGAKRQFVIQPSMIAMEKNKNDSERLKDIKTMGKWSHFC
jgi:hypothetical protein